MTKKEIGLAVVALIAALALFVPELFFFRKGFLAGDYSQQFFPYSAWYAHALKDFHLPLYTTLIGCGYSLFAEAQGGILYPVNLILFLVLPLNIAYQLNPLIHFVLGGLFAYLFVRNKGSSQWGGAVFALIFMFGANVCGIRYNTVVQKVLVWFPLGLYFIDRFFASRRYRFLTGLGILFILQIFAGFLQIALYCIAFTTAYFFVKLIVEGSIPKMRSLGVLALVLIGVGLVSFPQLLATLKMVSASTRAHQCLAFSLWGSSTPLVFATFIFPRWDFLVEGCVYVGIALIPFLFLFLKYFKESPRDIKIYFFLFLISVVCALGSFTPVLPFFIKVFHLSFIRKPSKFLFVGVFFLSVCLVWALEHFLARGLSKKDRQFALLSWAGVAAVIIAIVVGGNIFLNIFHDSITQFMHGYIKDHIHGTASHRYSLEVYYQKADSLLAAVKGCLSLNDRYSWISLFFFVITPLILLAKKHFKKMFLSIMVLDLFIFSQYATGLKGNFVPWNEFLKTPAYVTFLKDTIGPYRIYNFITEKTAHYFYENYRLLENENMAYGIPSVGIYAPLVDKDYYELVGDLGAIDDSLGRMYPTKEMLIDRFGLLSALSVKYIISFEDLGGVPGITQAYSEGMLRIYQMPHPLPPISFPKVIKTVSNRADVLTLVKEGSYDERNYVFISPSVPSIVPGSPAQYPRTDLVIDRDDFMAFDAEAYYNALMVRTVPVRGWDVFIDRKRADMYFVNGLLQGIVIPKGRHRVELRYSPYR